VEIVYEEETKDCLQLQEKIQQSSASGQHQQQERMK
jgi:hypothetical protein